VLTKQPQTFPQCSEVWNKIGSPFGSTSQTTQSIKPSFITIFVTYFLADSWALMWFDGPNQILPIFYHLMWFDGPKKLMWFDGPKSSFSPFKTSCVLMDPKPHVIWWTLIRVFKVFPSQNLMCFDGPTTRLKPHVFWWTQNLMWFDGPLMIFRVHQTTWGFWVHQNTWVHKKLMWFGGPIFSTSLGPSNHMRFL
jgi:hypothetical protein